MDMIHVAVYANAFLKQLKESTQAPDRCRREWEPGPSHGLRDLVRLATALGVVAAFAGFLSLATH